MTNGYHPRDRRTQRAQRNRHNATRIAGARLSVEAEVLNILAATAGNWYPDA